MRGAKAYAYCDSITPFGRSVVPEVYVIDAKSSGSIAAAEGAPAAPPRKARHESASAGSPAPVTTICLTAGSLGRKECTKGQRSSDAITTDASE
jgi:hypothetical protein